MRRVSSKEESHADGTSFTDRSHGYLPAYGFTIPWRSPPHHDPPLLL